MRVFSDTVADITAVDSDDFLVKHQTVFQEDNKTHSNWKLTSCCHRCWVITQLFVSEDSVKKDDDEAEILRSSDGDNADNEMHLSLIDHESWCRKYDSYTTAAVLWRSNGEPPLILASYF